MAYLVQHHGTFWFSIRVPVSLHGRFGRKRSKCCLPVVQFPNSRRTSGSLQ
ncbi:hypothetical protein GGR36_000088 [Niveibacterium umoris]|uniref:Uncharacterized protein n=1 Tax=Niveibacterium umoris TaxID=1193620 RepID=A0A840BCM3_9RHOO|nr:hypothetical protein [Niveibacterium umoris]